MPAASTLVCTPKSASCVTARPRYPQGSMSANGERSIATFTLTPWYVQPRRTLSPSAAILASTAGALHVDAGGGRLAVGANALRGEPLDDRGLDGANHVAHAEARSPEVEEQVRDELARDRGR